MATLVTRTTDQPDGTTAKGSELTHTEVDANFINLNTDKVEVSGAIVFAAKAGEALAKGDVVYVSGVSGNEPVVSKADADDAAKMPAFGLAEADANLNAAVSVVTFVTLYDLDTSAFSAGDTVYVSTTAGGLTATKPTGESSLLQNLGLVIRSHASAGSIKVGGAGRTNAVPNLNDGNVFIGNASNQAETRALVEADISDFGTYLTAEADTLDSVTGRGATTTNAVTVGNLTSTGIDDNATVQVLDINDGRFHVVLDNIAAGEGILLTNPNSTAGTGIALTYELSNQTLGDAFLDFRSVSGTHCDFALGTGNVSSQITGITQNTSGTISFATLGSERMLINSSGTVDFTNDVFTTGDFVAGKGSGSIALTINDSYGNSNIAFNHQNGIPDQDGNAVRLEVNTDTTSGAYLHFEGQSNVTQGVAVTLNDMARMYADSGDFHANGNVIAYSTSISDERLKENVEQVTGALDMLDQIRGVTFDRKDTGKKSAGVIAQELEQVMPYAIYETALPLKTGSEDDIYKLVEYDALHAVLIEAIKELRAEVEALRASSN